MPNWCECELTVTGPEEDIIAFKHKAKEQYPENDAIPAVLDANSFVPYPAKFRKRDEAVRAWWKENTVEGARYGTFKNGKTFADVPQDGFNSGGYEWCHQNWGTKWGICDPELVGESSGIAEYQFQCAWSPCTPVVEKMGKMFPTLRFELRYFEGGMCFQGVFIMENGENVRDDCFDYSGPRGG